LARSSFFTWARNASLLSARAGVTDDRLAAAADFFAAATFDATRHGYKSSTGADVEIQLDGTT
jgi:hypothetical protein